MLGMIYEGSVGSATLSESTGSIFVFSFDYEELEEPIIKSNWRGKSLEARFNSKVGNKPAFALQVFSVMAVIANDGSISYSSLDKFLGHVSPDGRQKFS
jgi:hypothetical protein